MWDVLEVHRKQRLSTWVREAPTVLAYSTVLAFHTFGMAFLVGTERHDRAAGPGLRPRACRSAPMEKFFRLIFVGFWVNAATGVVLTMLAARSLLVQSGLLRQARGHRGGHRQPQDAPGRAVRGRARSSTRALFR